MKALFLDFYGTLVQEDGEIIADICRKIESAACRKPADSEEIGTYWWQQFSAGFEREYGDSFRTQRELERTSMQATLAYYEADLDARQLTKPLLRYWEAPALYEDAAAFIENVKGCGLPVCIVSNIDRAALESALTHHGLSFEGMVTSEDVRAYKPRSEIFRKALSVMNAAPHEVLHMGDSLKNDVGGAQRLGIPAVWLNRSGRSLPQGICPEFTISRLTELDVSGLAQRG